MKLFKRKKAEDEKVDDGYPPVTLEEAFPERYVKPKPPEPLPKLRWSELYDPVQFFITWALVSTFVILIFALSSDGGC